MSVVLDARQSLSDKVPGFRRSIRRMRSALTTSALDADFSQDVDDIYSHEVVPAILEVRELLQSAGIGQTLSRLVASSSLPAVLGLVIFQFTQLPVAVRAGLAGLGITYNAAQTVAFDRQQRERAAGNHDLYFLYGVDQQLR